MIHSCSSALASSICQRDERWRKTSATATRCARRARRVGLASAPLAPGRRVRPVLEGCEQVERSRALPLGEQCS